MQSKSLFLQETFFLANKILQTKNSLEAMSSLYEDLAFEEEQILFLQCKYASKMCCS